MKKICLILILMLFTFFVFAEKVATLPDLNKPDTISIGKGQFYVTEGASVYIYSLKDFKLIKKFGKQGAGPQEFKTLPSFVVLQIYMLSDKIQINSMNKVSFFTFDGSFIEEKKHSVFFGVGQIYPIGDKFVSFGFKQESNKNLVTLNFYDSDLKKGKEIFSYSIGGSGRQKMLDKPYWVQTFKNKLFFAWSKDFIIDVFDDSGKKLYSIKQKYENIKFTEKHREEIFKWVKTNPVLKGAYENLKKFWQFPNYLPSIRNFYVKDNKIYVQTFKKKEGNTEFYIFDLKGKLLKKIWLKIIKTMPMEPLQLFSFKNNKLYQLIENEDDEEWELHIKKVI